MKRFLLLSLLVTVCFAFTTLQLTPIDSKEGISFTIKNFGLNSNGNISGLKGAIKWDDANPAASSFNVSVDVNTINTGIDGRDNHLKKEDFFDVAKYPQITFVSTVISKNADGTYQVAGNLTIKGVTKPVHIPFTVKMQGGNHEFEGEFSLNRRDYGVGGSSMTMSNDVKIKLNVQAK